MRRRRYGRPITDVSPGSSPLPPRGHFVSTSRKLLEAILVAVAQRMGDKVGLYGPYHIQGGRTGAGRSGPYLPARLEPL